MEDDKLMRRIFEDYKPDLGNDDDFMSTLEKKLDMVELVKRHRKTDIRRMKMLLAVTFLLGVLSAVFVVLSISYSPSQPIVDIDLLGSGILMFVNGRVFVLGTLSMLMSLGVIGFVSLLYNCLNAAKGNKSRNPVIRGN